MCQQKFECLCGNCGSTFFYDEAKIVAHYLYGHEKEERLCPVCGSGHYSPVKFINWLDSLANS